MYTVRTVSTLLDGGLGVFGVFDGHCGKEVAIFVQNHYLALLQVLEETKRLRKAKEAEQEWQCDRLWPLVD